MAATIRMMTIALLFTLLLWGGCTGLVFADTVEFSVIVHPEHSITELSGNEIKRLFLGKMKKWPEGDSVHLVINTSEPTQGSFTREILHKTPRQLSVYWRKALYSGRSMLPLFLADDQQVLDYVAKHRQAISIISSQAVDSRVKRVDIRP